MFSTTSKITSKRTLKTFEAPSSFCRLLTDCQRYLYETNPLQDLDDICKVNLQAVESIQDREKAVDVKAHTLSHQASMYESIGKVEQSIELNIQGRNMRLAESPIKGGLLGGFEQNLGYNYNTASQHEEALRWFNRSRDTWIAWNVKEGRPSDWPTVTKKNTARCIVYLKRYQEARGLLDISIREFIQERPLNWAMLAYAYFVLGILDRHERKLEASEADFMEAQNNWFKGDQIRLHPFNAGCLYKTGVFCLDRGKIEAAVKHLRDAIQITKFHADTMPAEHARCLFKLSEALTQNSSYGGHGEDGIEDQARNLRDEAEVYLLRRDPGATDFGCDEAYDQRIPIFWR